MTCRSFHPASLSLLMVLAFSACGGRIHVGDDDAGQGSPLDSGLTDGGGGGEPCGPAVCGAGLECCNESCGICTEPGAGCLAVECDAACSSNSDCSATEYCARSAGMCSATDASGTCAPRPAACTDEVAPVCGCDGTSYSNGCEARAAGRNVDHDGLCETCEPQDAAAEGACFLALGSRWDGRRCESLGGCSCVGADCDEIYPTAELCEAAHRSCHSCAANDVTATGACAAVLGVWWDGEECAAISGCSCTGADCDAPYASIAACEAAYAACDACTTTDDCDAGEYCRYEAGTCGATPRRAGTCESIPGELPCAVDAPVCGCDGATYACEDQAAQVGVSVRRAGACEICGTIAGLVCTSPDDFCFFPDHTCGNADEGGVCLRSPDACTDDIDPVCACDGNVYDNVCMAWAAGFDTAEGAPGRCAAP